MKLFGYLAAMASAQFGQMGMGGAPVGGGDMAANPMLMYSLLSGESTDMKSLLPFMMMSGGQQGGINPMMLMMLSEKDGESSSMKDLLPLMMMSGQGGDMSSMLPLLMMGDDNADLKV